MLNKDILKGSTILIVDDDTIILQMYSLLLHKLGANTILLDNARDCLEYIKENVFNIDLILLDMNLENSSGIDIAKEILSNKDSANIPIIFLSADNSDDTVVECLKVGAKDFIQKKSNTSILSWKIKTHIEAYKNFKIINELATKDNLTKCNTRHYFYEYIDTFMDSNKRAGENTCFMLVDIDNFKKINDIYGHTEGDRVLEECGSILLNNMRTSDMVIRWGGEEFLIIMKLKTIEQVVPIAEKLLNNIQTIQVNNKPVTISIGCSINTDYKKGIKKADECLYISKKTGKNKYTIDK